ncbi:tail fiber domain-containing protein [Reyranella soli]|uniref:Peptidase S74 domain-containing protein n=1 Tax=Reyranella soli TaxID=1230389 RepID=A0A512NCU0_9HYPH|nr:tail fiber domain-containing protein [Reyranella soli]GEP56734.1 hypothetical protein RSO01_39000 [Reyranella soli]
MLQVQSTSSQSKSEPHPYIQGDLLGFLDQLRSWYGGNQTAPQYQVANPSAAQDSARMSTWQWGNNQLNGLDDQYDPTLSYLRSAARGDFFDKSNDIMARKLDAMNRPQNEQFRDIIAPALNATFAGASRTGGGLHVDNMLNRYTTGIAQAQADAAAKTAGDVYGVERGLQSQAASALPGVLQQKTGQAQSWLGMLQNVGASDTANDQQRLDAARANFFAQPDFLTGMAQRSLGMFPGGQNISSGTTMGWGSGGGGGGGFGSVAGPIMSGLGTIAQFLPMLGISDARAKDIEGRVGQTDEGLPLYLYRYKGDDQPRIGPMAQEVAQMRPEAVARHPSGYLMIDYRKATPPGGLL